MIIRLVNRILKGLSGVSVAGLECVAVQKMLTCWCPSVIKTLGTLDHAARSEIKGLRIVVHESEAQKYRHYYEGMADTVCTRR